MWQRFKKLWITLITIVILSVLGSCSYICYADSTLKEEEIKPDSFSMEYCEGGWFIDHYNDDYYKCQYYYLGEIKEIDVYIFKTIYTDLPELKGDNELTITIRTRRNHTNQYIGRLIFWR